MKPVSEIRPLFGWLMQVANEGQKVGIHDVQLSDDAEFPGKTKVLVKLTDGQYNIAMTPVVPEHDRDTERTSLLIALSGFLESVKAVRLVLKELQGAFNE